MVNVLPQVQQQPSFKSKVASDLGGGLQQGVGSLISNLLGSRQQHPAQEVFNEMAQMLSNDESGIGVSPLTAIGVNRKGVENRNKFNSMRSRMESILVPMVNKGNLSNTRFNFIMEQIPKASDSQRAIAGKLQGLSKALGDTGIKIDTSALADVPFESESIDKEFKGKKKPVFDKKNPEHIAERERVLKKSKGNRGNAEKVLLRKFSISDSQKE